MPSPLPPSLARAEHGPRGEAPADAALLGRALSILRRRASMTQAEAAAAFDVTTQAWQNYEGGKRSTIFRLDQLSNLAEAVRAEAEDILKFSRFLAEGRPEGLLADPSYDPDADRMNYDTSDVAAHNLSRPVSHPPQATPTEMAPVYGAAVAGPVDAVIFTPDHPDDWTPLHPNQVGRRDPFYVRIMGDSVSPRFESGELAPAVRNVWPRKGQACVIETNENAMLVKFYVGRDENGVRVRELQPTEREFDIPYSGIRAVHAIVGGAV